MKKLFVGGISFNATEDMLKAKFGNYGDIVQLRLIRCRETGKSKGYAFITFANADDADKAKEELNGSSFDNRYIGVKDAFEKTDK